MQHQDKDSIEKVLLEGLCALARDDVTSELVSSIVAALKKVEPQHTSLLPTFQALIKMNEPDVQVFAALAIGRLGVAARSAISDLGQLMSRLPCGQAQLAAASALGDIADPASANELIGMLPNLDSVNAIHICGSLGRLGLNAKRAIVPLQSARRVYSSSSSERACINDAVSKIYQALRLENRAASLALEDPQRISLFGVLTPADDARLFYLPNIDQSEPHEGLWLDQRLKYKGYEPGECGIKIYQAIGDKQLVVLSWDNYSYGPSIINVAEYLATAVSSIYQLDPSNTIWIQHLSTSSGSNDSDESCVVKFKFDENNGRFSHPQWGQRQPLRILLGESGIEI